MKSKFAENLKKQLKKKGLSLSELARQTKMNRQNIYHYVNGRMPALDKGVLIADVLNIDVKELLK